MPVYAFVMDNPGHYVVGRSELSIENLWNRGRANLQDAAHLFVSRGQCVLTPIDVIDNVHISLDVYAGFGTLNDEYRATYEQWLELRRNPPSFEVQEGE